MHGLPELVEAKVKELREDAQFLSNMAGIYPGDTDGSISREAFMLYVMADLIAGGDWQEVMQDYEDSSSRIVITLFDKDGNEIIS